MPIPRVRALEAAVHLVGTEGLRSLTHARVDARAGLPSGSTSNYFRTRAALLSGAIDFIVERELEAVNPAMAISSPQELTEGLCRLIEFTTGENRILTTARLVLFLEASHDPILEARVSRGRSEMEASVVRSLDALEATAPRAGAAAIMACAEGIILHRIARHDNSDPRPAIGLVVNAALAPGE